MLSKLVPSFWLFKGDGRLGQIHVKVWHGLMEMQKVFDAKRCHKILCEATDNNSELLARMFFVCSFVCPVSLPIDALPKSLLV